MRGLIQHDPAQFDPVVLLVGSGSSEYGIHSCHQRARAEGFGHIFVDAKIKALELVPLIGARREHDDRHLGRLPDLSERLPSVHFGHHDIENDEDDLFIRVKQIHSFFAVRSFQHLISFPDKKIGDQLAHSRFIIDYKYLLYCHSFSPLP